MTFGKGQVTFWKDQTVQRSRFFSMQRHRLNAKKKLFIVCKGTNHGFRVFRGGGGDYGSVAPLDPSLILCL